MFYQGPLSCQSRRRILQNLASVIEAVQAVHCLCIEFKINSFLAQDSFLCRQQDYPMPEKGIFSFTVDGYQITVPLPAEVTSIFHSHRLWVDKILTPSPFQPPI